MATQQSSDQTWLAEIKEKLQIGLDDIRRGDLIDGETFMAELQQKLKQKKAQSE